MSDLVTRRCLILSTTVIWLWNGLGKFCASPRTSSSPCDLFRPGKSVRNNLSYVSKPMSGHVGLSRKIHSSSWLLYKHCTSNPFLHSEETLNVEYFFKYKKINVWLLHLGIPEFVEFRSLWWCFLTESLLVNDNQIFLRCSYFINEFRWLCWWTWVSAVIYRIELKFWPKLFQVRRSMITSRGYSFQISDEFCLRQSVCA